MVDGMFQLTWIDMDLIHTLAYALQIMGSGSAIGLGPNAQPCHVPQQSARTWRSAGSKKRVSN